MASSRNVLRKGFSAFDQEEFLTGEQIHAEALGELIRLCKQIPHNHYQDKDFDLQCVRCLLDSVITVIENPDGPEAKMLGMHLDLARSPEFLNASHEEQMRMRLNIPASMAGYKVAGAVEESQLDRAGNSSEANQ